MKTPAQLQASASAFCAWMRSRGLDPDVAADMEKAGALLAAARPEVSRWKDGKRAVPKRVLRIMELLPLPEESP